LFYLYFSSVFGHQNPGSGLDLDPDSLEILDPDSDSSTALILSTELLYSRFRKCEILIFSCRTIFYGAFSRDMSRGSKMCREKVPLYTSP
jgi:hypothetical protein